MTTRSSGPSLRLDLVPVLIIVGIVLSAGQPAMAQQATSVRVIRPPLDAATWCPSGPSQTENRPGFVASSPGVFNLGGLEASFVAAGDGSFYIKLATNDGVDVDNIAVWDHGALWNAGSSFLSSTCYLAGDGANPEVRVGAFDPSGPTPGLSYLETFDQTTDELRDAGWIFDNAEVVAGSSATELVTMGDDASVIEGCPVGGGCSLASGHLRLGVTPGPASVIIPAWNGRNEPSQVQLWWRADAGDELEVTVSDFAPCPVIEPPTFEPPSDEVVVSIVGADVDAGIDDDFGFIIDESDTEGDVEIGSEFFDLPQLPNDDHPRWGAAGRFVHTATNRMVQLKVDLWDPDSLGDPPDHVDVNPDAASRTLDVVFDRCTLEVTGNGGGTSAGLLSSTGDASSGDNVGTIFYKVETADGRPATADDIAMAEVDVVQVVHRTRYLVAGKPAVVMARIASNWPVTLTTQVRVQISGPGGFNLERIFDVVELKPGEVRKVYFFDDAPFLVPDPIPGSETQLFVNVVLDPDGIIREQYEDPTDCRRANDFVSELEWKVVKTKDLDLTWLKVGRFLDASSLARDSWRDEVMNLGTSFIKGTYPVETVTSGTGTDALYPAEIAGFDFLSTVAGAIGIPLDGVYPFLLVWHLNHSASYLGIDHVMGVLPYPDWFADFSYGLWANVTGLSLGDYAPHAVIFLPRLNHDSESGPGITVPAHELGHTFGLSVDRRLKDPVWCGVSDPFSIGTLVCGATGGLDEYKAKDPLRASGNPATGFWLAQGGEDPAITPLLNQEQCDRHCFMGPGSLNEHLHWNDRGKWIDTADYERLVEKLKEHPDPEVIYVSGMIDFEDNVFFGPWFRRPAGIPDRIDGDPGQYGLVFVDDTNSWLQVVGIPVHFGAADAAITLPVTFFGFHTPWPAGTAEVQLWRWDTQQVLASRQVTTNPPEVVFTQPSQGVQAERGDVVPLQWAGTDLDGGPLQYMLILSTDGGQTWGPLTGFSDQTDFALETVMLSPGSYLMKVAVTDGIHAGESSPVSLTLGPGILFGDDFESGGTAAWSAHVP